MPTNLRSKIRRGSATRIIDKAKAIKFRPLHKNSVYRVPKLRVVAITPSNNPRSQPTSGRVEKFVSGAQGFAQEYCTNRAVPAILALSELRP